MSSDALFRNVRLSVTNAKNDGNIDSLVDELKIAKVGLTYEESNIVDDLIDLITDLKDDKANVVDIIRVIIVIVETIQGVKNGDIKKKEAYQLFSDILALVGVSQRDRKTYILLFDGIVEMAFWGRDWLKNGGWSRVKRFFATKIFCCC